MSKIFRAILLLFPILYRLRRTDEDDDDDDDGGDPSFREKVKDLITIYFLTKGADIVMSLLVAFVKMRVIGLGKGIKIQRRTFEEIAVRLSPDFVSEDFLDKSVVKGTGHPDVGNYILVNCRTSVSIIGIFIIAFCKRWKWTTPEEAVSVYETKPKASSFYSSSVVCLGTVIRRPSCPSSISFAVPAFSFTDDEDDNNIITLLDIDEEFDEGCSFLFRVK